jgi:hypothetical protein
MCSHESQVQQHSKSFVEHPSTSTAAAALIALHPNNPGSAANYI